MIEGWRLKWNIEWKDDVEKYLARLIMTRESREMINFLITSSKIKITENICRVAASFSSVEQFKDLYKLHHREIQDGAELVFRRLSDFAAGDGNLDVLKWITEKAGDDGYIRIEPNSDTIMFAVEGNHPAIVKWLLSKHDCERNFQSLCDIACENDFLDVLKVLFVFGFVNQNDLWNFEQSKKIARENHEGKTIEWIHEMTEEIQKLNSGKVRRNLCYLNFEMPYPQEFYETLKQDGKQLTRDDLKLTLEAIVSCDFIESFEWCHKQCDWIPLDIHRSLLSKHYLNLAIINDSRKIVKYIINDPSFKLHSQHPDDDIVEMFNLAGETSNLTVLQELYTHFGEIPLMKMNLQRIKTCSYKEILLWVKKERKRIKSNKIQEIERLFQQILKLSAEL